jgi:hypothetical protein
VERKEGERSIEQTFPIVAHASFDLLIKLFGHFGHHHGVCRPWDIERVEDTQVID